ncbi:hypothetical protein [Streptomyces winkii]|uniref:hypothetical protein n=1 Tax=Streptomyces winkii TaxID=3051178 RepID=UPI0028D3E7E6|nr:hypothetical protein [Streptomyces sp. DSM 40971]
MTDLHFEPTQERKPYFWYGIPHGYIPLDLDPSVEQIEAIVQHVLDMPDELRNRAEKILRFYCGVVVSLKAQNVHACAVGMHPDETGEAALSIFSISTIPASGVEAKLLVASMAGTVGDDLSEGMRPLELPCGLGFVSEERKRTVAPGESSDPGEPKMGTVWQGTVAVTGADDDIILIQLVTPAVEQCDDYRNVLLGIAHTLTFNDPSRPRKGAHGGSVEAGTGSVAAAVRNDFG